MLVPLTQSLYVPGELADTEHVLVDIGTGYFVEVRVVRMVCICRRWHVQCLLLRVRLHHETSLLILHLWRPAENYGSGCGLLQEESKPDCREPEQDFKGGVI